MSGYGASVTLWRFGVSKPGYACLPAPKALERLRFVVWGPVLDTRELVQDQSTNVGNQHDQEEEN